MPHGVDRHGPVGLCLSCRHLQRQTVIEKRRVAWKQKSNVSRGSEKFDEKSRVSRSPRENFVQFYFVWWLLLRTMLGQRFTNPEKSKVKSLSCTLRAWRIIMQISRRLKITPGEKFAFLFFFLFFFFCVLQRNTHRGEAQRRRGRGEDSRRNPITFNAFAMCFEMKGDPKKNCNFSNGRSWRQKIESCLRACLSRVIIMFFLVWSNLYRVFHYREHTRNADFPESCSPVFAWKSNVHVSFFRFFLLLRALLDKSQKEFLSLHFRLCFSNLMPRGVTRLFP